MCKVTRVMHLEHDVTVHFFVKSIEHNPTYSVGGYIFPVVIAGDDAELSHAISPGYGG